MDWLIWTGAGISLLGLLGLVLCIRIVVRARRAKLPDDQMRAALIRAVQINMGSFLLAAAGLAMAVVGVILS